LVLVALPELAQTGVLLVAILFLTPLHQQVVAVEVTVQELEIHQPLITEPLAEVVAEVDMQIRVDLEPAVQVLLIRVMQVAQEPLETLVVVAAEQVLLARQV
jgi:hypothetical protein